MPQILFGLIINCEGICVIDSGTTHTIFKDEKYFSTLLRRKTNISTISGNAKIIKAPK